MTSTIPPRIVATDLDGTLLTSSGAISPRTDQAMRLARSAGAEIVFVTARPPRSVRLLAGRTGLTGLAICSNGAVLYDLATEKAVASRTIEPRAARRVADSLAAALPGVAFAVETGTGVLTEAGYTRRVAHDVQNYREVASACEAGEPIVKLLVLSPAHTTDEMNTVAVAAIGGLAEVTHSGVPGLLEVSAPGVTKAAMLAELCRERGVEPAEVVAFGDMPNDLPALAFAGAGYAMANAHPLVLAAARHRTSSNDEDGVAQVLERLYG
ncbi:HAD family hydrolase [Nonomuraea spiralis]|uniref:HAD family hydrolase n=1 Tax=Nonomuraea TaxID=83681 RepID=UPI0021AD66B5|nr:HAD family hydrolase [Nonomuraea sp. WAC 01424]